MATESKPTHEQAQLHLQIYDLRREERLRQARDWFFKSYNAKTFDDMMRIAGTELGLPIAMNVATRLGHGFRLRPGSGGQDGGQA